MRVIRVDPAAPSREALAPAGRVLREGGLVAFPTETVYGLGANALDDDAVMRIFRAKGRPGYNPLIVHVASSDAARELALEWTETAGRLAEAFWPGPLTLVLPKRAIVPDRVTAGLASVALRVPGHAVARALLEVAGVPVAAPSANRSTEISPTTAAHVEKGLRDRIDVIVDGGPAGMGIESTVVDLTQGAPVLLRPGSVSAAEIEAVAGEVRLPTGAVEAGAPRPSPGMMERHYAPRADLRLYPPARWEEACRDARRAAEAGMRVGSLTRDAEPPAGVLAVRLPADPAGYARGLYAALHELDERCDLIVAESVPATPPWAAVSDRLTRAARPA